MQSEKEFLGELVIIQVQSRPLKTGGPRNPFYDPSYIISVNDAELTGRGLVGKAPDGTRILDAHHAEHPETRFGGRNGISIGFTGHYDRMRTRFGDGIEIGAAGENLVIAGDVAPSSADLEGRLVFENPDGSRFEFRLLKAMAPCDEFSHFVNGAESRLPPATLKATLQFLEGGTRGFTLELVGAAAARLQVGARLYRQLDP